AVVFVILVAVYRSVLLPIFVLLTAVAALCGAIVAVYGMALAGWIQLNGQAQGILSILVIGAATDYCLLLVARHREELLVRADVGEALRAAVRGSFGAITASASTVALALLILMASDLNSTRSLGPVAATGVAFAWLAALTLLPALLRLTGRAAFWPTIP
ncbi:MMPL family transporter, partial [Escherichia coli]|nr:MMPL family transporter [Escherichia coli]